MRIFRKTLFDFLRFIGLHRVLRRNDVYAICLHRVSDDFAPGYPPMKTEMFSKLMEYVNQNFEVISLNEINNVKPKSSKKKKLLITFDDGYLDFKTNALPILNKYNFPVTVNLITDVLKNGDSHWTQKLSSIVENIEQKALLRYLKEEYDVEIKNTHSIEKITLEIFHNWKQFSIDEIESRIKLLMASFQIEKNIFIPMMKWNDINEISSSCKNVSWGSHTQTHLNLGDCKNEKALTNEIVISKQILENELKTSINTFAFPNGDYTLEALKKAKKHYNYILLTEEHKTKYKGAALEKIYFRDQLYYNSLSENIMKIYGLHRVLKRM